MKEACSRFLFVNQGRLTEHADFDALTAAPAVRAYLGRLAPPI